MSEIKDLIDELIQKLESRERVNSVKIEHAVTLRENTSFFKGVEYAYRDALSEIEFVKRRIR